MSPDYVELLPKIGRHLFLGDSLIYWSSRPGAQINSEDSLRNLNCENIDDKKDDRDSVSDHLGCVQPRLFLDGDRENEYDNEYENDYDK